MILEADKSLKTSHISPVGVTEFIGGVLDGLIQDEDFSNINQCVNDGTSIGYIIDDAFTHFEKGDSQDIVRGLQIIGSIMANLPDTLKDCQLAQKDLDRIEKWAQIFKNPTNLTETIVKNTINNFAQIQADISVATSEFKQGDYLDSGI